VFLIKRLGHVIEAKTFTVGFAAHVGRGKGHFHSQAFMIPRIIKDEFEKSNVRDLSFEPSEKSFILLWLVKQ